MPDVQLEASWKEILAPEFERPYFKDLIAFLKAEKNKGKCIYPAGNNIFKAFELCPFKSVKVLILGQDPYHGPNQAHGLSFSVPDGIPQPPSLQNIYKELASDIGIPIPESGNLTPWAEQGVLLLNAALTVEAHQANSHKDIGWHAFTDAVIRAVSDQHDFVVFVLWGRFAQSKLRFIDAHKHVVIQSAHPSPLSAYQGFFGSKPFSKINTALIYHKKKPIRWG
ncbi:MAG: uracil-DNA glycosylase [Chitinophagaceae bacterium]|nr:uracil-DNA glycosylase [Chitinophagaceae bacterium]